MPSSAPSEPTGRDGGPPPDQARPKAPAWFATKRGRIRVEAAVSAASLFLVVGPITVAFNLDAPGIVVAPLTIVALLGLGLGLLALYVEVMVPTYGGRLNLAGEFVPLVSVSDLAAEHHDDLDLFYERAQRAAAFQEEDESERAVARLVSGTGPPPLHSLLPDSTGAADAPPDVAPLVCTPPRPGGIAERWYWLTYDLDEHRRLPALWALDWPALTFDRILTGEQDVQNRLLQGPMAPPPGPATLGAAIHARAVGEMRRILCGDDPRDAEEALLTWLVKYGDIGSARMLEALFPTKRERRQARRRLRGMLPDISAHTSPAVAGELIAMLYRLRPSGSIGALG